MATLLQIPAQCFCSKPLSSSTSQNGKINKLYGSIYCPRSFYSRFRVRAVKEKTEEIKNPSSAEEVTKKYGLEAGLWKIFSSKETNEETKETTKSKGDQAKELLTKYGGAYLATSITLSLISFGLCYALISAGVDVPALLQKIGISTNEAGEKVGTFALAYAAHKAASPIRFPPTVALTPVVAGWIGKKVDQEK
ncbi:protein fam210b [Phtheirospermum japonicum]|uniref:Protein fam210b n=1 Tax=Phtheirospermum japonicum TaxID=374723 RepID=A0A830D0Q7_9LAMI|nr:protein fam210b [Phtheirospermum japonicum]